MSGAITLTLSETQALCAKAVRGAGYPWGIADEAGRAAGWLAAQGLPGAALILDWAGAAPLAAPEPAVARWAGAGPLCPVKAGMAMADHARLPEGPRRALRLDRVAWPGLLLPFVAMAARLAGHGLSVQAGGAAVLVGADGAVAGDAARICEMQESELLIAPSGALPERAEMPLPVVPAAVWQALEHIALGATVPPSATSRSGAGAAGSDND